MTTFFLNRLATEPHALAFAGQSTPWPVALADQTTDPNLDEALTTSGPVTNMFEFSRVMMMRSVRAGQ